MALAGAGVAGEDQTLLAPGKLEGGQIHDLAFVDTLLKGKIEVREQFSFRKFCFPDASFDSSFDKGPCLQGQEPFEQCAGREGLLCRPCQLFIQSARDPVELECFEIGSDPGCRVLCRHG